MLFAAEPDFIPMVANCAEAPVPIPAKLLKVLIRAVSALVVSVLYAAFPLVAVLPKLVDADVAIFAKLLLEAFLAVVVELIIVFLIFPKTELTLLCTCEPPSNTEETLLFSPSAMRETP